MTLRARSGRCVAPQRVVVSDLLHVLGRLPSGQAPLAWPGGLLIPGVWLVGSLPVHTVSPGLLKFVKPGGGVRVSSKYLPRRMPGRWPGNSCLSGVRVPSLYRAEGRQSASRLRCMSGRRTLMLNMRMSVRSPVKPSRNGVVLPPRDQL